MSNSLKITLAICFTAFLVALVTGIVLGASFGSRQHNQIIRDCINANGQWVNGSCVRNSR